MGKLNNFSIGKGGVNNTKSPIHLDDSELVQAQNAEFDLNNREGGLRKRGGLTAHNASALNSGASILGVTDVPLLTTFTETLYAALMTEGADTWLTSADGTTWTAGTTPARAATWAGLATGSGTAINYYNTRIAGVKNSLIYPGNDYVIYNISNYTDPPVRAYIDGTTDVELARIPIGPGATAASSPYIITDMLVINQKLYFGTWEAGGAAPDMKGRVISLDLTTGIFKQIGNGFGQGTTEVSGGLPWTLCHYRGQLYCGLHGVSGSSAGKVVRINPDADASWTSDVTGLQGYPLSLCVYKGDLFAGLQGDTGEAALVVRRAAGTGSWTTSDTGSGSTTGVKYYGSLMVHNDKLLAVYHHTNDDLLTVRSYDNSAWATDVSISGSFTPTSVTDFGAMYPGQPQQLGTNYYLAVQSSSQAGLNGFIMKRTSAGAWSIATQAKNIRGYLGLGLVRS